MNLSTLAYSLLTGAWRHDRAVIQEARRFNRETRHVREQLTADFGRKMQLYAGAEPGINRPYPNQLSTPEDYKQAYQRIVLIRAAQQLEEDSGFFDGILDDFETYVIGENPVFMPNTGNPEANRVIRDFLELKFSQADFTGRLDLTKIAQLAIRSMKRDGDCGFIPVQTGDDVQIRYYSGDCIGNPYLAQPATLYDFNGIVTDPDSGEIVAYRLFKRVPKMAQYVFEREVEADNFWHYYDPFRFQQYHGVSIFKNAIEDGFDIDQILEYTKLNIKWRASQLPTVHTADGRPKGPQFGNLANWLGNGGGAGGGPAAPGGPPTAASVNVDGVRSTYMQTDDKVMEYPNDFPNSQLPVAIEEFRRQSCKGAKLPYEFVYRADNGGVVQRFWVDKAMKTFAKDKHLIKRCLLNPFKNRVTKAGIESGELDLRRFGNLAETLAVYSGQWRLGAQTSVDYGRETDADLKQIEAGLMSPVDYAADQNRDLDEVRKEIVANAAQYIKDGQQLARETGLSFDQVMPFLVKKWPNPAPVAAETQPAAAEPTDDPVPAAARKVMPVSV
jgi:capsid protein